jgi:hypothetical protein
MYCALLFIETTDPACSLVVLTMATQYTVNLIHQLQRKIPVVVLTCLPIEFQEVTYGKSVGPQVAPRILTFRRQTGRTGKIDHVFLNH